MKSSWGSEIRVEIDSYGDEVALALGEGLREVQVLLTPKKARKLAKKLLRLADQIEDNA